MAKFKLYREMIRRLDAAIVERRFFEASWYAYAILEDRLISLLRSSACSRPPRMMGPKIGKLNSLSSCDPDLVANFEESRLSSWKDDRNDLMHAMAEGSISIQDIDQKAESLALNGAELVRIYSAAAMRKKRRAAIR